MQHYEELMDTKDGLKLYTQGWAPDTEGKAVICLVHGLGEHSNRYAHVADFLVNNGFALDSYDLRGHGKSGGACGNTPSYDALLDDIAARLTCAKSRFPGKPIFLYGHSLGGNQVINFALRRQPEIAGFIATGPWLRLAFEPSPAKVTLGRIMNSIYPSFSQANGLETAALSRDGQVVKNYENDPLVHDRISARLFTGCYQAGYWALDHAADLKRPMLLMHGSADRLTSAEASREFAERAGKYCTLKIWEGLYHEIHNEPDQVSVLSYLLDWLNQNTLR